MRSRPIVLDLRPAIAGWESAESRSDPCCRLRVVRLPALERLMAEGKRSAGRTVKPSDKSILTPSALVSDCKSKPVTTRTSLTQSEL